MSKLYKASCPDCGGGEVELECAAWRGADGTLYASEEAEALWVAGAPERAAVKRLADEQTAAILSEYAQKNRAESAAGLPLASRLLDAARALGMHRLCEALLRQVEEWERDPEIGGEWAMPLVFVEAMRAVLGSAAAARLDALDAFYHYSATRESYDQRYALAQSLIADFTNAVGAVTWIDRLDHLTPGGSISLSFRQVVELLPLLESLSATRVSA